MSRKGKKTGRISLGAWSLAFALLPALAYQANGQAAAPADDDTPATTSAAPAPARVKIPPPRTWPQASGRTSKGPAQESVPAANALGSSAQNLSREPSAVPAQPASRSSEVDPASTDETLLTATVAPRPSAAEAEPPATDATQAPSPRQPQASNLADSFGLFRETEQAQENLLSSRAKTDHQINQAGCATCGGFHSLGDGSTLHESIGCAGGSCIPGRKPCYPPVNQCDTLIGAFCQNLYQCLCCPDPCYQPQWVPAANASFFADYARPRTVTRLRYDNLESMTRPDRNQFWIQGVTAMRKNGRRITDPRARLQQFYVYQEAAAERGSFFIEYPYRQINQSYAPTQAGFSDLNFGIKSLMFDCELLQITFQFRTFTPTGNGMLNLGTGHFAPRPLDPHHAEAGPGHLFPGPVRQLDPPGRQPEPGGRRLLLLDEPQPGPLVHHSGQPLDRHPRDG